MTMAMPSVAVQIERRQVLADLLPGELVRDLVVVVAAAGIVGALAQLSIPLGFTPVPITGQTLGVLLAGSALGWRRASAALSIYLVAGLAGVPWFAGHQAGNPGADLGYLVGFVVAAAACGWLAERGADRRVLRALPAMFVGEVVIYAIGVPYLALDLHVSLARAIALGFTPFLIGDALKAGVAAGLLPAVWRAVGVTRRPTNGGTRLPESAR